MEKAPLPERRFTFHEEWTPEQCIEAVVKVWQQNPDRFLSRDFFRSASGVADATWTRYFGTWKELRRQANLELTRQQHQLEREIAKHASVDHYRALAKERLVYASKYDRPANSRFRTLLVACDLHDKEVDPFFLRVFLDACAEIQPEVIAFGGDLFDLPEFGKFTVDPRDWDAAGRIQFVHQHILHPVREACPDSQMDLIAGNHEWRLLRHLSDATPALKAVLSDLHGMTLSSLFALDQFQVNYIDRADLSAWTKRDAAKGLEQNYQIYWGSFMVHHFPHARKMGMAGINGHHHKHVVWPGFSPVFGPYEWHQIGCGHKRRASYCEGEQWANGFAIVHVDTQTRNAVIEYVPVNDFAVVGGKWHVRAEHEKL